LNGVQLHKPLFQIAFVSEKTVSSSDLMLDIESDKEYRYLKVGDKLSRTEYYDTHFYYDDVRILADFAKALDE
jgi:hypothetical protein